MTATPHPSDRPPGLVSTIRGRWQRPLLERVTQGLLVIAVLGGVLPGAVGSTLSIAAVALVIAVPLLRVCWLTGRWFQERDLRFVAVGAGLLTVVAIGAALAALGVGS